MWCLSVYLVGLSDFNLFMQAENKLIEINVQCCVQGDVILEYIHMDEALEHEEVMFRVMFNTAFVKSKALLLNRDEIDVAWNAKDMFREDFKVEVGADYTCTVLSVPNTMVVETRFMPESGTLFRL